MKRLQFRKFCFTFLQLLYQDMTQIYFRDADKQSECDQAFRDIFLENVKHY